MGFKDMLSKLGILRFGFVKKKYHNAKERPIEFQQNGVFNAEKDLISIRKSRK